MTIGEAQRGLVPTPAPAGARTPHVLLDIGEVHAAVRKLADEPAFVFDVETFEEHKDHPNPQTNTLVWVGLGGPGSVYLIPVGHPKGVLLQKSHREKVAAFELYGSDDKRSYTPKGVPSMRMVDRTVAATYAEPPTQLFPDEVAEAIRPLLFSDKAKVGHNIKFDLQTMAKYYGGQIPPGPYHDTILITHVLDENLTDYGLKALTCEWFKIPQARRAKFYPDLGRQGIGKFGIDEVARYLARDLRYCWLRYRYYHPRLVRKGLKDIYDFEMSIYPVVMDIESAGFPVDRSAMGKVRRKLEDEIQTIEHKCWALAGDEFPLSHTDSKRWVLFGEGIPAYGRSKRRLSSQRLRVLARTPKEKVPQVTQAILEYYSASNPMADLLLRWSVLEKLRGTFVESLDTLLVKAPLGGSDVLPRIHTSLKQHGTVTGRFSSASPNLQQLPRGSTIRELFVAGPGNLLIVADYDQIELRCAAYESGDREMTKVFWAGQDIHAQAAATMFRLLLEQVTEDLRDVGKTQNFAVLYGAAEDRIAAVARCSKTRARQLIRLYYERFSELEPWKAALLKEARSRGDRSNFLIEPPYVSIPPFGRKRRLIDLYELEDWKRWRAERQAVNAKIQGFASYITKLAMLVLHQELRPHPAQMVVQVHDEIVFQVAEGSVDEVLPLVREVMSGVINGDGQPILGRIPLVVSAKAGYTWAEAKRK